MLKLACTFLRDSVTKIFAWSCDLNIAEIFLVWLEYFILHLLF